MQNAFSKACSVEINFFIQSLTNTKLEAKAYKLPKSTVYEESCTKFARQYSESLLIEYCNQSEILIELQKSSTTNPNLAIKYNTEKSRLDWLEGHLCFVFDTISSHTLTLLTIASS